MIRSKKKLTANDIHRSLRMDIITGKAPSGTRLTEENLAVEFGVSRTPVREALRMLERDRLIVMRRGRGASVVSLSREEVIDTYQCRGALRGLACRLAAERITPNSLERLSRIIESLEVAVSKEDVNTIFTCTVGFNQIIAEVASNRILAELLNALDDRTFRIRFMAHTIPERVRFALYAYQKMYAALEAQNGAEAELIARSITENAKDAILRFYYQELPEALAQPKSLAGVS